jgi:hypothetical protein
MITSGKAEFSLVCNSLLWCTSYASLSFVLWNGLIGYVLPKNSRSLIGWTVFPLADNGFCRGLFHNIIDCFSQWFRFQHLHTSIVDSLNLTLTEWKTKKKKEKKKKKWSQQVSPISPTENGCGKPVQCSRISSAEKERDGLCDPTRTVHRPSKTFCDSVMDWPQLSYQDYLQQWIFYNKQSGFWF